MNTGNQKPVYAIMTKKFKMFGEPEPKWQVFEPCLDILQARRQFNRLCTPYGDDHVAAVQRDRDGCFVVASLFSPALFASTQDMIDSSVRYNDMRAAFEAAVEVWENGPVELAEGVS
jgi:hypothetical protein